MNESIREQEFRAEPFHDIDALCQDAEWRYGSLCECDGDENLTFVTTLCSDTPTNVSVGQEIRDGFVTMQQFCDDTLCVIEELNYSSSSLSSDYSSCYAFHNVNRTTTTPNNSALEIGGQFTCYKHLNLCWKNEADQAKFGFVIHDGLRESLLCFRNNTIPIFVHNSDDFVKRSSAMLRLGAFLWIVFMTIVLVLFRDRDMDVRRRSHLDRSRSYIDVALQDVDEDAGEDGSRNEVELAPQRHSNGPPPARRERHEEDVTLPVAFATPIQKYFESGEFDETDESEEWSG